MRTLAPAAFVVALLSQAGPLSNEMIRTIAKQYLDRTSIPALDPQLSMQDALRVQTKLVDLYGLAC